MNINQFYISMRQNLLEIISGVKNAEWSLFWDNTTSNYSTKLKLEKLLKTYRHQATAWGLFIVTRHCDCPNSNHAGYLTSNDYGLSISYQDEKYIWGDGQMFQGTRFCNCPCTENSEPTDHWVIDDVIYARDADLDKCKKIESVLFDIADAIECAKDRKPRSGIREYLLRAVLKINDELLPTSMDSYIKKIECGDS